MILYHIKLFFRNFLKYKFHYLLNILGLTLGISCFVFTLLYVFYEHSFEGYHENKNRIARVVTEVKSGGDETKTALANGFLALVLPDEFPEIEAVVRFKHLEDKALIKTDDLVENIMVEDIYLGDPQVFRVFSYGFLEGNPATCLAEPNTIVITKTTAEKLFGSSSALNKFVVLNGRTLKVTGVLHDLPGNSDFKFQALISSVGFGEIDWAYSYILFDNADSRSSFQSKLDVYTEKNISPVFKSQGVDISYTLEPLEKVHFSNNSLYDTEKGNKVYVYIFLTTGIFILLIACVNYISLTVVKSYVRISEVNIQKIFGASQARIILQFIVESFLLVFISTVISFFLVYAFLPGYANVLNRSITHSDLFDWRIALVIILVLVVLGVSGALYMAFSSRNLQLSGTLKSKSGSQGMRIKKVVKSMLGLQFFISFFMLIAGLLVYQQVNFLNDAPLGFNYENVLVVELPQEGQKTANAKQLKLLLDGQPQVKSTAFCGQNSLPGQFSSVEVFEYQNEGIQNRKTSNNILIDEHYFKLLEIPILKGNHFREKDNSGTVHSAIVSNMFVKNVGWENPIGQKLVIPGQLELEVVGVIPDFHFSSLHNPIEPMIIIQEPGFPAYILVKTMGGNNELVVEGLKQSWSNAFPEYPLNFFFLEDFLSRQYLSEHNLVMLLLTLTGLIVLISCLGLIAYCSYIIKQDSLEIAVKRILGASFWNIYSKFIRQFLPLLVVTFILSSIVAWYLLNQWLDRFSYHIDMGYEHLFVALLGMILLMGSIMMFYTLRGVRINPVKLIREN